MFAVHDFVSGYEVTNWFCAGLPQNTPAEIVNTLGQYQTDLTRAALRAMSRLGQNRKLCPACAVSVHPKADVVVIIEKVC